MLHGYLKLWSNSLYKMGLPLQNYPKMTFSLCSHGYCVIDKEFTPIETQIGTADGVYKNYLHSGHLFLN